VNLLRERQRLQVDRGCCYIGGSSKSATENKTEVRDMRVVGAEGSTNVSMNAGDNSTTTVTLTDHGAVAGGLDLGSKAIDAVVKNGELTQNTAATMYSGALQAVQASNATVADMASQVAGQLATAFTDAKAPDKSILIVGGAVVIGLAALTVLAKR
jgi:hypothetical protein